MDWDASFDQWRTDPLQQADPWADRTPQAQRPEALGYRSFDSVRSPYTPPAVYQQHGAHSAERGAEAPTQRFVHDIPPTWDGKDPDNQVEPYLKSLAGWLTTTRTLKSQRGLTILQYSTGDLKVIINELELSKLTSDDSGQLVLEHVKGSYREYLERRLPRLIEKALFSPEGRRQKSEGLVQYVARKKTLLGDLTRSKCDLPASVQGYVLLRDAMLPDKAWDMIETWTRGDYDMSDVAHYYRCRIKRELVHRSSGRGLE